jgi:hypothetical protein
VGPGIHHGVRIDVQGTKVGRQASLCVDVPFECEAEGPGHGSILDGEDDGEGRYRGVCFAVEREDGIDFNIGREGDLGRGCARGESRELEEEDDDDQAGERHCGKETDVALVKCSPHRSLFDSAGLWTEGPNALSLILSVIAALYSSSEDFRYVLQVYEQQCFVLYIVTNVICNQTLHFFNATR